MDNTSLAGGIAVILVLFKVFDYFTKKKLDTELLKIIEKVYKKMAEIEDQTKETFKLHNRYDEDGIPLWYFPRSYGETQSKVVAILQEISNTLRAISDSQANITEILKELNKRK